MLRLEVRDHDSFKKLKISCFLEPKVGVGLSEVRLQAQEGPILGESCKPC